MSAVVNCRLATLKIGRQTCSKVSQLEMMPS
nr:MAG TPA: hypothetical protein [Caudoviricetes sp.]